MRGCRAGALRGVSPLDPAASAAGPVLALDLGEVRTGVAISDPGARVARPLEVVESGRLPEYLEELVHREGVAEVVAGVPKTLGGEVGFQARKTLSQLEELRRRLPEVRFVEWDERFTTRLARSASAGPGDGGRTPRRSRRRGAGRAGKEPVDHLAAARMLQEYLDLRERP
ncbi:MAG: pre-16S rRNA-processing nuclease YqgF [Rubrobacter sp.]|nr:pre-16S rRNA-processing nuclease YqgF [Rubrobacter sp.]